MAPVIPTARSVVTPLRAALATAAVSLLCNVFLALTPAPGAGCAVVEGKAPASARPAAAPLL